MSRSTLADYREFIRVSVDLPLNPKLAMIDDPAAGWAYVVALCYCGQNLTDGAFPLPPVLRLAGVKPAVAQMLVAAGLWHESGHECDRCPQPLSGMGVVHDYLIHQRSADEAKSLRDVRREAGRKGATSRWSGKPDSKSHSKSHSNGSASASQTDDKSMPEVEVEEEKELKKKTPSSSSEPAAPPRDDVEQLVTRLRERLIENDFKTPATFADWRRHARLLLDRDKRELGQALRLLDWATNHHFWMGNIRSMGKFRSQYEQLLVQAKNEYRQQQAPPAADRITGWQSLKNDRPKLKAVSGGDYSC